jgi:hypothetical protein
MNTAVVIGCQKYGAIFEGGINIGDLSDMKTRFLKRIQLITEPQKNYVKDNNKSRRKTEWRVRTKILKNANRYKEFGLDIAVILFDRRGKVYGDMSDKYIENYTPNMVSLYDTTQKIQSNFPIQSNDNLQRVCATKLFNMMNNQNIDKMDIDTE